MSSNDGESARLPWGMVLRDLHARGLVPEDILYDGDAFLQWWRSLTPTTQEEIIGIVRDLSQGQLMRAIPATVTEETKNKFRWSDALKPDGRFSRSQYAFFWLIPLPTAHNSSLARWLSWRALLLKDIHCGHRYSPCVSQ